MSDVDATALRAAAGHVVFINSGAGRRVNPGWTPYAASKFAARALADGLRVVGINIDVDLETAERTTEKHRLPYTVLHDAQGVSAKPFQVQQIPATFLFDAEGRLVWQTDDELAPDDPGLRAALKRVLPRGGPAKTEAPDARLKPLRVMPSPIPPVPVR